MQVGKSVFGYVTLQTGVDTQDCSKLYSTVGVPVVEVLPTVNLLQSVKATILDRLKTDSDTLDCSIDNEYSVKHGLIHFIYLQPIVFDMLINDSHFYTLWFESYRKFDLKGLGDVFGTRNFIAIGSSLVVLSSDVLN